MKLLGLEMVIISAGLSCSLTHSQAADRRLHSVRVLHTREVDLNTPQTKGITQAATIGVAPIREREEEPNGRCSRCHIDQHLERRFP